MTTTSQPLNWNQNDECHAASAPHIHPRPRTSTAFRGVSATDILDLASRRDWLLGVDRVRRDAKNGNGVPVRLWPRSVKPARLSVAGLMVEMPSLIEAQEQFIRCYLREVLTVTRGNVSWAARLARRNRTGFHRLLVTYKLAAADFRSKRHSPLLPNTVLR